MSYERLPDRRTGYNQEFTISAPSGPVKVFLRTSDYPDRRLGLANGLIGRWKP